MVDQSTPQSKKRKANDDDGERRRTRRRASEAPSLVHGRETVTVHVGHGSEQKTFAVHQNLLIAHSEFIKAAVSREWKEAQKGIVSLEEDNPESFEIFYSFLYTGQIFSAKDGDFKEDPDTSVSRLTGLDAEWARLNKSWRLGQKLLSTTFKDAVTDALISKVVDTDRWPLAMHEQIYPCSSSTSAIRKVLVDVAAWKWSAECIERRSVKESSAQFYFDLALALKKLRASGDKGEAGFQGHNTCVYHEHEAEGVPCYKTMFQT